MTNPDERRSQSHSGTPYHQRDPVPQPAFVNVEPMPQPIADAQCVRPIHVNAEAGPSQLNRPLTSLEEDDPFAMDMDYHPQVDGQQLRVVDQSDHPPMQLPAGWNAPRQQPLPPATPDARLIQS
jgi:hypothetical protein